MLEHLNAVATNPQRVVILGAAGFVGGTTARLLSSRSISTLALGRAHIDLLSEGATDALRSLLLPSDAVVVVAARAPCKDSTMLVDNIRMLATVCHVLEKVDVNHVVYISSDAVYRDSRSPLDESSCAEPGSLHGVMHLTREIMLKQSVRGPLAILRPTLLYGAADPHNGYGPNRFVRLASSGQEIVLFGEGEEQRDHVLIDDVAAILLMVLRRQSRGTLNVATGEVHSFRQLAERIAGSFSPAVPVRSTPRQGPMPHGGYRAFDPAATHKAFPGFRYTTIDEGIDRLCRAYVRDGSART